MFLLPEIAGEVFETPLCIDPRKAATMLTFLGPRVLGQTVLIDVEPADHQAFSHGRPSAAMLGDKTGRQYDAKGVPVYDKFGSVAVIPIEGSLVAKGNYVGSYSGRTSYQGLQAQITRAARDPSVNGVVFEVDSMGGQVKGMFETADMLARLSKMKPTMAILTDSALSAAYALASAARTIVVPEYGSAGSIGAIALHADMSGNLEKNGVKVTVIRSGARKAEGNPYEALSSDAADSIQASLDNIRTSFAEMVGRHRGARFNAKQALATEAAAFDGAEAVSLGLADAVADPNEAFATFLRRMGNTF